MATSIRFSQVWRFTLLIAVVSLFYTYFSDKELPNPSKGRNIRRPKFAKKPTKQSAMASEYLKSIANRRTIYALSKESTISHERIQEILVETIKHSPSSFNNQAQRAVLLVGAEHDKLWDFADAHVKEVLPQAYEGLKQRLAGYRGGYGTVMFFEDSQSLEPFVAQHPNFPFGQWGDHSQGMLQIHTWDAFELEGLGANLQHYNFIPGFTEKVRNMWDLPATWDLRAQLVFGKPTGQPYEKKFDQVEGKRLLAFGV